MILIDENNIREAIEYCLYKARDKKELEITNFNLENLSIIMGGYIQGFCGVGKKYFNSVYKIVKLNESYVGRWNKKKYEYRDVVYVLDYKSSNTYYVLNSGDSIPKEICEVVGYCECIQEE